MLLPVGKHRGLHRVIPAQIQQRREYLPHERRVPSYVRCTSVFHACGGMAIEALQS